MILLSKNIDPAFDRAFPETCARIGCNPLHLLAVMVSEANGADPSAHNPHGDASGLIQFMPATLRQLNWKQGDQAFRCLSASQQLPYVEGYYRPWAAAAGKWDSPGRLYQATFLPGTLSTKREPDDIIAAHGGVLGWAFDANSAFDADGNKTITIAELTLACENAIARFADRWVEVCERIGLKDDGIRMLGAVQRRLHGGLTVVSVRDVQRALNAWRTTDAAEKWELPELTEDGIPGPKTTLAIRIFQEAAGLLSDGKAGPKTRAALAAFVSD